MPEPNSVSPTVRAPRPWSWLWDQPADVLLNVSAGGELLAARVRLAVIGLLFFIPVIDLFAGQAWAENVVGLVIATLALATGFFLLWLVRRESARRWLAFGTSAVDVTMVSATLAYFAVTGRPDVAVNSKIVFDIYFLSLAMTCLRYDERVCALAGGLAMFEHFVIIAWSAGRYDLNGPDFVHSVYGVFSWSTAISREILLLVGTLLTISVVRRARRLHELSTNDYLTGLHNRGYFDERFREEVIRARRHKRVLSVAMLDVDKFKLFNDTWGHSAGDIALQEVAQAVRAALRQTDVVARYGGEELVLILPETPADAAVLKLEDVRRRVAGMSIALPRRVLPPGSLTLSAGVACAPDDGNDVDQLLGRADTRLFAAKQMGRNRVVGPDQHSGLRPSSAEYRVIAEA
jgi:diguanylate cyclase (GGDEF)-like protein